MIEFSKVNALRKRKGESKSFPFCTKKNLICFLDLFLPSHFRAMLPVASGYQLDGTNLDHFYCCGNVFGVVKL